MTVLIEAILGCVDEVPGSLVVFGVGTDVFDVAPVQVDWFRYHCNKSCRSGYVNLTAPIL